MQHAKNPHLEVVSLKAPSFDLRFGWKRMAGLIIALRLYSLRPFTHRMCRSRLNFVSGRPLQARLRFLNPSTSSTRNYAIKRNHKRFIRRLPRPSALGGSFWLSLGVQVHSSKSLNFRPRMEIASKDSLPRSKHTCAAYVQAYTAS